MNISDDELLGMIERFQKTLFGSFRIEAIIKKAIHNRTVYAEEVNDSVNGNTVLILLSDHIDATVVQSKIAFELDQDQCDMLQSYLEIYKL